MEDNLIRIYREVSRRAFRGFLVADRLTLVGPRASVLHLLLSYANPNTRHFRITQCSRTVFSPSCSVYYPVHISDRTSNMHLSNIPGDLSRYQYHDILDSGFEYYEHYFYILFLYFKYRKLIISLMNFSILLQLSPDFWWYRDVIFVSTSRIVQSLFDLNGRTSSCIYDKVVVYFFFFLCGLRGLIIKRCLRNRYELRSQQGLPSLITRRWWVLT